MVSLSVVQIKASVPHSSDEYFVYIHDKSELSCAPGRLSKRAVRKLGNYGSGLQLQKIIVVGLEVGVTTSSSCLLWLKLLPPHFGGSISAVLESQGFMAFGIGLQVSGQNMR